MKRKSRYQLRVEPHTAKPGEWRWTVFRRGMAIETSSGTYRTADSARTVGSVVLLSLLERDSILQQDAHFAPRPLGPQA